MQKLNMADYKDKKVIRNNVVKGIKTVQAKDGFSYITQEYFLVKINANRTNLVQGDSCVNRISFDVLQLSGKDAGAVDKNVVVYMSGQIMNKGKIKFVDNFFTLRGYEVSFPANILSNCENNYVVSVQELARECSSINKRLYKQAYSAHQEEISNQAKKDMCDLFSAYDELNK